MADPSNIVYDGLSVGEVYRHIVDAGADHYTAGIIASNWVLENLRRTRRVFAYKESFAAVSPHCVVVPWVRTFVHTDWTDGEDVVQAGSTTGEEGFNARFHKIEADLDRLGADVGKLSACLAEMRASLRKVLDELRAEINLINSDIHECCHRGETVTFTPPNMGLVNTGIYKGTTELLGKTVSIWETKQGLIMLPSIETIGLDHVFGGGVLGVTEITKFVNDDKRVQEAFRGEFKLQDFVKKFGEETLPGGRLVRDTLRILPPESFFKNVSEMVDQLSTWEAAVLRSREGSRAAASAALGLDTVQSFSEAPVEKLTQLPFGARAALASKGFNTLGALANADPARVRDIVASTGLDVSLGDAAGWTTGAKTIMRLGPT